MDYQQQNNALFLRFSFLLLCSWSLMLLEIWDLSFHNKMPISFCIKITFLSFFNSDVKTLVKNHIIYAIFFAMHYAFPYVWKFQQCMVLSPPYETRECLYKLQDLCLDSSSILETCSSLIDLLLLIQETATVVRLSNAWLFSLNLLLIYNLLTFKLFIVLPVNISI